MEIRNLCLGGLAPTDLTSPASPDPSHPTSHRRKTADARESPEPIQPEKTDSV